ncbi:MAG: HD domain-containing phosphohydrolase [Thermovirgaceae bacterium]
MKIRRIFAVLIIFLVTMIIGHLVLNSVVEIRRQLSELDRTTTTAFTLVNLEIQRELARLEQSLPLMLRPDYEPQDETVFDVRFVATEGKAGLGSVFGEPPSVEAIKNLQDEWKPLAAGQSETESVIAKRIASGKEMYILGVEPHFSWLLDRMPTGLEANLALTGSKGEMLWESHNAFGAGRPEESASEFAASSSGWFVTPSGKTYWGKGTPVAFGQFRLYILYPLRRILWLLFSRLSITAAIELFFIVVVGTVALFVARYVLDPMDRVSRLALKMQDRLFRSTTSRDLAATVSHVAGGIREINSSSRVKEVRVFCQTLSSALQSYVFQQEKLAAGSEELASLNKSLSQANEALISRDRIWRRILDVSKTVTMGSGFQRGLILIAEGLRDVSGAYGVLIGKRDQEEIHVLAGSGFGSVFTGVKMPMASAIFGDEVCPESPVWLENVHAKGNSLPLDPDIRTQVTIPMVHMGKVVGNLTIGWRTRRPEDRELLDLLVPIASHIGGMLNTQTALQELRNSYQYLTERMQNLTAIYHDETADHLERMEQYCRFLGTTMGLSGSQVDDIALFSRLHDIGKLRVPVEILSKPTTLESWEFETVKRHTLWGAEIIGDARWLDIGRKICLYHHEKWDGSGYPYGIAGEDIPLEARIVAVADTYDALRMQRSYKDAFSHEAACNIILDGDGRVMPDHFDPEIIDIFARNEDRMQEIFESSLQVS